jgi:hypothetical protein
MMAIVMERWICFGRDYLKVSHWSLPVRPAVSSPWVMSDVTGVAICVVSQFVCQGPVPWSSIAGFAQ